MPEVSKYIHMKGATRLSPEKKMFVCPFPTDPKFGKTFVIAAASF